jgi:trk system potassium uptake protein TrkA
VVGRAIEDIDLPEGATIGAIVREAEIEESTDAILRSPELALGMKRETPKGAKATERKVFIAHDDLIIQSGDHVIVFVIDKRYTRDIERLFQVGFTFF